MDKSTHIPGAKEITLGPSAMLTAKEVTEHAMKQFTMDENLEKAQREVDLVNLAIKTLEECAREDRKIYHSKHQDKYYLEALDRLEVKKVGAEAYLFRVKILGY